MEFGSLDLFDNEEEEEEEEKEDVALQARMLYTLGRVEKSKNGIKSYGYCFLGGFWYVKTRGKNFGGHRKFFAGWNFT